MVVIVTQTTWFKDWLRGFIVRQAEDYVNGRLSIGRLDGNLFFGVELEDVDVTVQGEKVVELKDVGVDYNFLTFLNGDIVLDDLRLNRPVVRVEKTADGWNLARLIKARTPDPDEPKNRRTIAIGEIGVSDGTVLFEDRPVGTSGVRLPERIERLDASVGVRSNEGELVVDINHRSLRSLAPGFGLNAVSGVIRRTRDAVTLDEVSVRTEESAFVVNGRVTKIETASPVVDLKVSSEKLALDELAGLVPALRAYPLQPAFDIAAVGPAERLEVTFSAREPVVGGAGGTVIVDAKAPGRRVTGNVALRHFNAGPVVKNATMRTDVTGQATIDLTFAEGGRPLHGTYTAVLDRASFAGYGASRVRAEGRIDDRIIHVNGRGEGYGATATAVGTIRAGGPLQLDLAGHAAGVDMRRLPAQLKLPAAPSTLSFDYRVSGRGKVVSADATMDESTIAGGTIAAGTTGSIAFGDGAPRYTASGSVNALDIQQVGQGFNIAALKADRYRSRVTGTFTVNGSGGGRYPLTLDASGTAVDSEIFGAAIPRLETQTRFADGDAQIRAIGRFEGLDPAIPASQPRYAGKVTGAADLSLTLRQYSKGVTVDSIDASGRVNLGPSEIGGLAFDTAVADGHYASREGVLNQLSIDGRDLKVTGYGPIALNDTGASNLTLHVEAPSLERLQELIRQPLSGAAVIDATLTGNGRELKASGTLDGSNVSRGNANALNLDSTFSLAVPDLEFATTTVNASSHATFVQVAGQKINELTAETTYDGSTLNFNATAKEGVRELTASGAAIFHPEHQEIRVKNLGFRAQDVEWRTETGSEATLQYGRDQVVVKNVRLVSGEQRIAADGTIGAGSGPLELQMTAVDLAQLDQMLLLNYGMGGRLNATGTVTGEMSDPRVSGEFMLAPGSFKSFTFESLAGTVNSAGKGAEIDVRLQQTPTAWLTAKGYVPRALIQKDEHSATEAAADGGHHDVAAPGESIGLEIASSQIDLGVVQGFTSYVTNVTGALQANVKVTGSAHDPHLDGVIDIRGGAFTVPRLGTAYTGLDTRIDLKSDTVSITEMRIVDEHQRALTVGGTLAVHEREVGAVNVAMTSENFEVIDNRLADLKLDTDVKVTGTLRAPRVVGYVEVENGTVDVARVLEQVAADPYATEALEYGPAAESAAAATPAATKLFDGVDLEVGIAIPGNLVLKGSGLRPANAPIDAGDINVTVGGAVQIRKTPGGKTRLIGEVNTIRGSYDFQGRRFEILRDGRIRFDGSEELDPVLDLRTRRIISGVETFVTIRGTMNQPELSFSSRPPLPEADILSLIVFNLPINELGEGQQISLTERAGALAGGYLASGLTRSLANALEIDELEIQAGGEDGQAASLTVGEQVGERLFVKLRQGFGAEQATEFILEYQISDFLRLQSSVAETAGGTQRTTFRRVERGGIDLIFFFAY